MTSDQHHHHHHSASEEDTAALIEQLDLDGEVFDSYLASVIGLVADQAADRPVRRIADLGCGTGNGALKLAQLFGDAEVIAVDSSAPMLARLQAKARDRGLDGRVRTVQSDLDGTWPLTGTVDLVWMSMALHHLADPKRGLAEISAALNSGGLLALAELTEPLRFLPDDLGIGQPGLEERCNAAQAESAAAEMPYLGADWGPLISQAGYEIVTEQRFDLELVPPVAPAARRYALGYLKRSRSRAQAGLTSDDLATLDALTSDDGPYSVLRRSDLHFRGARTLWIAAKGVR
ncbi:MAG TPA: class I SAM-dependent methyltransferase [Streptosporangiaceae bacterium]|nr:class I SAM-dependent methyltransferase [Streptosporangiaceae bacterium]